MDNLYRFNRSADIRFRQTKEGFDIRVDDSPQTAYFEGSREDAVKMRDWLSELLEAPHA